MEFLIGIFVGGLFYWLFIERKRASGTFIIDLSDPLNDELCRLIMDEGLNEIASKKRIFLNVKTYYENSPK